MSCEKVMDLLTSGREIRTFSMTEKVYMVKHIKKCTNCCEKFTILSEEAKSDPKYESFLPTKEEKEAMVNFMAKDAEL